MRMAPSQKSAKMQGFMPFQEDTRRALDVAERAALRAGELVMEGWRVGTEIARKGRFDLLTKYDLESEHLIREALSREFPSHRIVGEEGAETGEGELVWYVDPIDGTTNYAHGHFFFAVSIALYRGREGLVGRGARTGARGHLESSQGHGRISQRKTLLGVGPRTTRRSALRDGLSL